MKGTTKFVVGFGITLLLIVGTYAFAPWFHWFWFDTLFLNPGLVLLLIATITAIIWSLRDFESRKMPLIGIIVLIVVGFIAYIIIESAYYQKYMAQNTQAQVLKTLPETKQVRFLPLESAQSYGNNTVQDPTIQLGNFEPLDLHNELVWVSPRIPNGFINSITGKQDGFEVINSYGSVKTIHQPFTYGEGMFLNRNITWQLHRRKYFVDLTSPYYVQYGDEVMAVVPYESYYFEFPVWLPQWGGVFVVHSDGRIEDLSPQQAQRDPRFINQRLYPEDLASIISNAWGYKHGIGNAWFLHKDQTEIPSINNSENQMPYLLPTVDGPQWFVAAEPSGESSHGIFKMFFFDAHSGVLRLYQLPSDSSLLGPNSALDNVRSDFPSYTWVSTNGSDSNNSNASSTGITDVEPRPVIYKGKMYWMVSIKSVVGATVSKTVLIDIKTGSVDYSFDNVDQFDAFLSENSIKPLTQQTATNTQSSIPDVSKLSNQQLIQLQKALDNELEKRLPAQ